jgi:hypothetical protein
LQNDQKQTQKFVNIILDDDPKIVNEKAVEFWENICPEDISNNWVLKFVRTRILAFFYNLTHKMKCKDNWVNLFIESV